MNTAELDKAVASFNDFSGVILIREGGNTLYQKACGLADVANGRPNRPDTRFGIASGSKSLTATAICILAERNKLKLEDSLALWLPDDCPPLAVDVSILDLLCHCSGLPDYFDEDENVDFAEIWRKVPNYSMRSPADFLPLIKASKAHPERKGLFSYNNGAYVLLALIVERASGESFPKFVTDAILRPLGMDSSGYFFLDRLPENCATGYIQDEEGLRSNIFEIPVVGGGDGGLYTTAADMGRYWDGLLGGRLLGQEMLARLLEPRIHVENDVFYGLGIWIIKQDAGILKYYLTGGDPGLCFYSARYPEQNRDVTFISNGEFDDFQLSMILETAILAK